MIVVSQFQNFWDNAYALLYQLQTDFSHSTCALNNEPPFTSCSSVQLKGSSHVQDISEVHLPNVSLPFFLVSRALVSCGRIRLVSILNSLDGGRMKPRLWEIRLFATGMLPKNRHVTCVRLMYHGEDAG